MRHNKRYRATPIETDSAMRFRLLLDGDRIGAFATPGEILTMWEAHRLIELGRQGWAPRYEFRDRDTSVTLAEVQRAAAVAGRGRSVPRFTHKLRKPTHMWTG